MGVRPGVFVAVALALLLSSCVDSPSPSTSSPPTEVAPLSPTPAAPLPLDEEASFVRMVRTAVDAQSLREQVASVVMVTVGHSDPLTTPEGYADLPLGGFLLLRDNFDNWPDRATGMTQAISRVTVPAPLVAVDQEGPPIRRIPTDTLAGHNDLAGQPAEEVTATFSARNALVSQLGATVNFGLVADLGVDPEGYITQRTFGADPIEVSQRVEWALAGTSPGVAQTLKHFPGHGMTPEDSHSTVPVAEFSEADWWATHSLPFQAGINAGAPIVMMGHIIVPSVSPEPASLSGEWVEILREDLGFSGLIVTDDLSMLLESDPDLYPEPAAVAALALAAGSDLLVYSANEVAQDSPVRYEEIVDGVVSRVEAGELSADRVADAATRVLALRYLLGGVDWGVDYSVLGQF